jgi:hypothetical protein
MFIRGSIFPAGDRSQRDTYHDREVSNLTSADNTEDVWARGKKVGLDRRLWDEQCEREGCIRV